MEIGRKCRNDWLGNTEFLAYKTSYISDAKETVQASKYPVDYQPSIVIIRMIDCQIVQFKEIGSNKVACFRWKVNTIKKNTPTAVKRIRSWYLDMKVSGPNFSTACQIPHSLDLCWPRFPSRRIMSTVISLTKEAKGKR